VKWSRGALSWLREIHHYIERDNPDAASRTVQGILDRIEDLVEFPEIGQSYTSRSGRKVRLLLYGHYRIAYQVTDQKDIRLLGIFHGSLELERRLR
jgi:plasmid stabilization system protein ParE